MGESLTEARACLRTNPAEAETRAETILRNTPGQHEALLILGTAYRFQGRLLESLAVLKPLVRTQPKYAEAHVEWAVTQAIMGLIEPAITSLRTALALQPAMPGTWRLLAELLASSGDFAQADVCFLQQVLYADADALLREVVRSTDMGDLGHAERLLRERLAEVPRDVAALRMLADLRLHAGDNAEAAMLCDQCLSLAPSLTPARVAYVAALLHQGHAQAAAPHLERLLRERPNDPLVRVQHASLLAMTGDRSGAIDLYRAVLRDNPSGPNTWLRLGHVLRTAGRASEAVEAYRQAAALEPSLGDAYWSLANLKMAVFSPEDITAMRSQLAHEDISDEDRVALGYALGSALERTGHYEESFCAYKAAAQLQRQRIDYSAERTTALVRRSCEMMTPSFFGKSPGGDPDRAPIFVVGLPRSGTTLIEQILASHSQVEGTSELRILGLLAAELGWETTGERYPASLAGLSQGDRARFGRQYLERCRMHRLTDRPFFIDKMPDNFLHAGFIHLILPHAKIIDVRRHPMAACFSAYKQLFARGTAFSYDLRELGLYYRDYVTLMDHLDRVLPSRVHHVRYETLVADTEAQIRALLGYCGVPFEPACLRFYETTRDVTTASSEQVRQPIFSNALDHWRHYEPWLCDLRDALRGEGVGISVR